MAARLCNLCEGATRPSRLSSQVRAYGALKPEDRHTFLTEKSARERLLSKSNVARLSLVGGAGLRASLRLGGSTPRGAQAPSGGGRAGEAMRRSRAGLTPLKGSSGGAGGAGVDLRKSVHNVLQQHFNPSELVRLSMPADMFNAARGNGLMMQVATIREEEAARMSGGSGAVCSTSIPHAASILSAR